MHVFPTSQSFVRWESCDNLSDWEYSDAVTGNSNEVIDAFLNLNPGCAMDSHKLIRKGHGFDWQKILWTVYYESALIKLSYHWWFKNHLKWRSMTFHWILMAVLTILKYIQLFKFNYKLVWNMQIFSMVGAYNRQQNCGHTQNGVFYYWRVMICRGSQ